MDKLTYKEIIEKLVLFAEEDESIRAALIVGSRARSEMPADKWSDLDLVIFAESPQSLLADKKWILKIGKPYITFLENTAVGGGTERRVLFEEGLDVDFSFFSVSSLSVLEKENEVIRVFSKGVRVLIDKDSLIIPILQKFKDESNILHGLGAEEVENIIHDFWYHAVLASKKIRRGELLDGKSICDSYMKNLLISLVKTQTKLEKGADFDTWHGFRFFEKWAEPNIVQVFMGLYAHYEENEIWTALKNTMNVFRNIAIDVSERLNMKYPYEADEFATKLVELFYTESKLKDKG